MKSYLELQRLNEGQAIVLVRTHHNAKLTDYEVKLIRALRKNG